MQASANTDLFPLYQSHKRVRAGKITKIEWPHTCPVGFAATLEFGDGLPGFFVTAAYMEKHKPEVGGYWVLYEDGYQSWSPAEAFESGYTRVD